jgi:serine/threonine protein kinase
VVGERRQAGLDDTLKLKIAYGVARGMEHLHRLGILHRDLKLENILYDEDGPRIGGFTWSKAVRPGEIQTSRRGTFAYAAPEVLAEDSGYGLPADVYSYGICLWELMTGRLWGDELPDRLGGAFIERGFSAHGHRPPLDQLNQDCQDLLRHCFGADVAPEGRLSFGEIVRRLEASPQAYFAQASLPEFAAYKSYLDGARVEAMDENLMYLLRQLQDMSQIGNKLEQLPPGSPSVDIILFCLGRMFGDDAEQNCDVVAVARYQFATKRRLDGSAFLDELDALQTFPPGRSKCPLLKVLIDPNQPVGTDQTLLLIPISTRDDFFRALRNVVAGICCQHPCVLKVHGWNIVHVQGDWAVAILADKADRFSVEEFERWSPQDQSKFLLTVAIGMLEIHSRGVLHNGVAGQEWLQVKDGRAQICNFGLLGETASFLADTVACQELFNRATDEFARLRRLTDTYPGEMYEVELSFEGYINEAIEHEQVVGVNSASPLRDLSQEIKNQAAGCSFPIDLYWHLIRSVELWASRDGPLDVADGLAQLTRGLDEEVKSRFKMAVNEKISAFGSLPCDFVDQF